MIIVVLNSNRAKTKYLYLLSKANVVLPLGHRL